MLKRIKTFLRTKFCLQHLAGSPRLFGHNCSLHLLLLLLLYPAVAPDASSPSSQSLLCWWGPSDSASCSLLVWCQPHNIQGRSMVIALQSYFESTRWHQEFFTEQQRDLLHLMVTWPVGFKWASGVIFHILSVFLKGVWASGWCCTALSWRLSCSPSSLCFLVFLDLQSLMYNETKTSFDIQPFPLSTGLN